MQQQTRRIFITGSNRGLGRDLVKLLHKNNPEVQIHISSRGNPQELSQKWAEEIPNQSFRTYQIDLNNTESIAKNAQLIKTRNIQFDTIVANAAVGCDYGVQIPSVELAQSTLNTNVTSTIDFIKQFLPLLSPNGRIVIVSSFMASLSVHSQQFRNRVDNPQLTEEEIRKIVKEYIESAARKDMGYFHKSAYRTSKALLNAWARFILPYFQNYAENTQKKGKHKFVCTRDGAKLTWEEKVLL